MCISCPHVPLQSTAYYRVTVLFHCDTHPYKYTYIHAYILAYIHTYTHEDTHANISPDFYFLMIDVRTYVNADIHTHKCT